MKTKILFLFAWLMATATGCSADEPRKELPDTPPAEKQEEPADPAGDRKVLYGAQNEAYKGERGRKTPKAVYLQRVARVEAMRSAQNEMFT